MKYRLKELLLEDENFLNNVVEFLLQLTQIKTIRSERNYGLNTYDNDFLINYYEDFKDGKFISLKRKLVVVDIILKYSNQIIYFSSNQLIFSELKKVNI